MLEEKKIGFIGGGQMCQAIFSGALRAGALRSENIFITDTDTQKLQMLADSYHVQTLPNTAEQAGVIQLAQQCDVIVLAIKPQYSAALLQAAGSYITGQHLVISIMGGVTLQRLEEQLPSARLVRVMPNTPMLVGRGSAGIALGAHATAQDSALCTALFNAVGSSYILPESLIDPLTAVSGCGPAFAYMFIEALADGGVEQGLSRDIAQRLAAETLAGAAAMVLETELHPAQLKDSVCSPGGATIAGVHALEDSGLRGAVMDAVAQSRTRMEAVGRKA